jgi:hypothetical protein
MFPPADWPKKRLTGLDVAGALMVCVENNPVPKLFVPVHVLFVVNRAFDEDRLVVMNE